MRKKTGGQKGRAVGDSYYTGYNEDVTDEQSYRYGSKEKQLRAGAANFHPRNENKNWQPHNQNYKRGNYGTANENLLLNQDQIQGAQMIQNINIPAGIYNSQINEGITTDPNNNFSDVMNAIPGIRPQNRSQEGSTDLLALNFPSFQTSPYFPLSQAGRDASSSLNPLSVINPANIVVSDKKTPTYIYVMDMGLDFRSYQYFLFSEKKEDVGEINQEASPKKNSSPLLSNVIAFNAEKIPDTFEPTVGLLVTIIQMYFRSSNTENALLWLSVYKATQKLFLDQYIKTEREFLKTPTGPAYGQSEREFLDECTQDNCARAAIKVIDDKINSRDETHPDADVISRLFYFLSQQNTNTGFGNRSFVFSEGSIPPNPKGTFCNLHLGDRQCRQEFSCNQIHLHQSEPMVNHRVDYHVRLVEGLKDLYRQTGAIGNYQRDSPVIYSEDEILHRLRDSIFYAKYGNKVTLPYQNMSIYFFKTLYTPQRLDLALNRKPSKNYNPPLAPGEHSRELDSRSFVRPQQTSNYSSLYTSKPLRIKEKDVSGIIDELDRTALEVMSIYNNHQMRAAREFMNTTISAPRGHSTTSASSHWPVTSGMNPEQPMIAVSNPSALSNFQLMTSRHASPLPFPSEAEGSAASFLSNLQGRISVEGSTFSSGIPLRNLGLFFHSGNYPSQVMSPATSASVAGSIPLEGPASSVTPRCDLMSSPGPMSPPPDSLRSGQLQGVSYIPQLAAASFGSQELSSRTGSPQIFSLAAQFTSQENNGTPNSRQNMTTLPGTAQGSIEPSHHSDISPASLHSRAEYESTHGGENFRAPSLLGIKVPSERDINRRPQKPAGQLFEKSSDAASQEEMLKTAEEEASVRELVRQGLMRLGLQAETESPRSLNREYSQKTYSGSEGSHERRAES